MTSHSSDYPAPMCMWCQHRTEGSPLGLVCTAYPEVIPDDIRQSRFDHRKAKMDDNGIRFKARAGTRSTVNAVLKDRFG